MTLWASKNLNDPSHVWLRGGKINRTLNELRKIVENGEINDEL